MYAASLYDDAAKHYQDALATPMLESPSRLRITEKLAYALYFGENPKAAEPLFERLLNAYLRSPLNVAKAIEMYSQLASQLLIDAKAEASLPLLQRSVELANENGDERLRSVANIRMARALINLDRFEEAERYILELRNPQRISDLELRSMYYHIRGNIDAAFGRKSQAYENFEQAIESAKGSGKFYQITPTWQHYAHWAGVLGDIRLAKSCLEQAMIVARRGNTTWHTSFLILAYAGVLFPMGRFEDAHEYLREALARDVGTASLEALFAVVGIPLALQVHDEKALIACADYRTIEKAFQSGQPAYIGAIAAAFAQLYAIRKEYRKAGMLLRRALEYVHSANESLTFSVAVARWGALSDIPRARILLERRMQLPHAAVFQAHLALFDAYVARRQRNWADTHTFAADAVERFDALEWHGYADSARSMLPASSIMPKPVRYEGKALANFTDVLTEREQRVAELILRGLTNRQIATELLISVHTVDSHVASIMNRLGLRSRYQLAQVTSKI